jgi:hypothetical protein
MKSVSEEMVMDYGRTIAQRVPIMLLTRVEEFEKKQRCKTRTDAINALLEIALIVVEHKDILKDEHLKDEITQQLREGGLVDYFRKLTDKDLAIMNSIVRNEVDARK